MHTLRAVKPLNIFIGTVAATVAIATAAGSLAVPDDTPSALLQAMQRNMG
jgi:hypothetical protein